MGLQDFITKQFGNFFKGFQQDYKLDWEVLGSSVPGYSHVRKNTENQDAILWYSNPNSGYPFILALSDGHGDSASFRSKDGAKIAVNVAIEIMSKFLKEVTTHPPDLSFNRIAKDRLPKEISRTWRERILDNWKKFPMSKRDADIFKNSINQKNFEKLRENIALAYGATLSIVAIHQVKIDKKTHNFIIFLRLGDGDFLVVSDDGQVINPFQSRLDLGDDVFSLSMKNAWEKFDYRFVVYTKDLPRMILLTTDGYRKSYNSLEEFEKIGTDILNAIKQDGIQVVENSLDGWLSETSKQGSGDDISLGICLNTKGMRH